MKVESYAVICPECKGARFIGRNLCSCCDGNGRVIVPEVRERTKGPRLLLAALIVISIGVAIAWRFL